MKVKDAYKLVQERKSRKRRRQKAQEHNRKAHKRRKHYESDQDKMVW